MLTAFIMSRRNVNFASRRIIALNFAQETLEDLKGKVGISGVTPGRGDLDSGDYTCPLSPGELRDTFGGIRDYSVTNLPLGSGEDNYDFKQVTVTVTWNEPGY
jgi:hypothetical protein